MYKRKGIQSFWRPVYNQSVSATTASGTYVTVLDLTANKKGKIAVFSANYGWVVYDGYIEIYTDGLYTHVHRIRGGDNVFRGDFHFNKSIRVRHKTNSATIRTDVAYWVITWG